MLTYGELCEECRRLADEAGCDLGNEYQLDFLKATMVGITDVVSESQGMTRRMVRANGRGFTDESMEIDESLIAGIQRRFETTMEEEDTAYAFGEILSAGDKAIFNHLLGVWRTLSTEELADYIRDSDSDVFIRISLSSPLRRLIDAVLYRNNSLVVMQECIREAGGCNKLVARPNPIVRFINGFRELLARNLSNDDERQKVFIGAVLSGNAGCSTEC